MYIGRHYNIKALDKWYEHEPVTITGSEEVTILWDMQIHTDREIVANKLGIVIKDHMNKTSKLLDLVIPLDRNTSLKLNEKLSLSPECWI